MSDLRKLIEAVEAGTATMNDFAAAFPSESAYGKCTWRLAWDAFNSDMNAAKTLHEALLPEDYVLASNSTGFAQVWHDEHETTHIWVADLPGREGRARLLAILKALDK